MRDCNGDWVDVLSYLVITTQAIVAVEYLDGTREYINTYGDPVLFVDAEWKVDALVGIGRINSCSEVLEDSVVILNPGTIFYRGLGKPRVLSDDRSREIGIINSDLEFGCVCPLTGSVLSNVVC